MSLRDSVLAMTNITAKVKQVEVPEGFEAEGPLYVRRLRASEAVYLREYQVDPELRKPGREKELEVACLRMMFRVIALSACYEDGSPLWPAVELDGVDLDAFDMWAATRGPLVEAIYRTAADLNGLNGKDVRKNSDGGPTSDST